VNILTERHSHRRTTLFHHVRVPRYGKDTTSGLDTKGKRGNVEKEQVLGLLGGVSGKNGGLDSGTVGDNLVGALVELSAAEEVGHELDDTGLRVEPLTRMISCTSRLSILESPRTFSMGSRVLRKQKRCWQSSSKHE
jgi:hypothetical protein